MGYRSTDALRDNSFIPSNKWRELRRGITSTAKFNGVLCYNGMRLAVYDIGNGDMEWQTFAEGSLFFRKYGTYETQMTGMLWVCDGNEIDIAEQILRYTISKRSELMKHSKLETNKKWAYSFRPLCLKPNYEKVFITDRNNIAETLRMAECEKRFVDYFTDYLHGTEGQDGYDIDVHPKRYFVNPQGDLLKFAKCFDTVKSKVRFYEEMKEKNYPIENVEYHILISRKFEKIVKMYDLPFGYSIIPNKFIREVLYGTDNEEC